ncbi:BlaI/MecI/CopY family transcriptional regulator [Allostreptomyces psammosilenae]|uniref:Putative transcriptional regulator n=1 Tax=Allostreptomyces psammosilenae TaxID=1892865 RepID=A0A852ZTS3_9ACTN|nr:BlaI/MecI/CopY family transcriptional regulator [Allostreptomyces psammosilenae]NYI05729.1 putative transcriptional regulator [Allostreptomyces psammosilenae]
MPRRLGDLEDAVMTRIWTWNRPVTVREVLDDLLLERDIAYTTVMTVMDKLHQKGWLRREREGRAFRYAPVATREAYTAALMRDAWATSENRAAALVHFIGSMSAEELDALRDALRVVPPAPPDSPAPPSPPATPSPQESPSPPEPPSPAATGPAAPEVAPEAAEAPEALEPPEPPEAAPPADRRPPPTG